MQLILAYDSQIQTSAKNTTSTVQAWCLMDDLGLVHMSGGAQTLAEIKEQTKDRDFSTTVLLMSPDVLVTQIPRPPGALRKLQQALPYMLEEQLAEDVEDLHFAVLNNDPNTLVVGVIKKQLMQACFDELNAAELSPHVILPFWFALPVPAVDHWQIFIAQDYVWLRMKEFTGYSFEQPFAAEFSAALLQKSLPLQVDCISTKALDPALTESFQARNIPFNSTVLPEPAKWIEYIAKNLPETTVNLLQGEFSVSKRSGEEMRWWRLAKRLAISIIAVWFGGLLLQLAYLSFEYHSLENKIKAIYFQVMPNEKTVTNPRLVFDREIQRVSGGQSGTDFLSLLLRAGEILQDFPQITLLGLNYDNNQLTLNFTADNFSRLQQLEERFAQVGLKVEKESATSSKGVVQANWRVG